MTLHHRVRGSGPFLLIGESGEGDADRSADLAAHLADRFTVITYDRRGLWRSPADGGVSMTEHADDAAALLDAVAGDEPVDMLGCSIGAVIGLHAALRHPGRIRTLIAHEPVCPSLLPPAESARQRAELESIRTAYRSGGLTAAVPVFRDVLGIDATGPAEDGLTPQPMDDRRRRNFDRLIEVDLAAVAGDVLDVSALPGCATRIVPAFGTLTPTGVLDRACAFALADLLGTDAEKMPGGHNGNLSHPRAFAERVAERLAVVRA